MTIVGNILLGVISGGLHKRLEGVLEKSQIDKIIKELGSTAVTDVTAHHHNEDYYHALESYVIKENIVPSLIEICYYKRHPDFVTQDAFAKSKADLFIAQNKQYLGSRSRFLQIFRYLYKTVDSALNNISSQDARKISNEVVLSEHNMIEAVVQTGEKMLNELEKQRSGAISHELLPFPHLITAPAPPVNNEFSFRDDMVEELYEALNQNQKLALINGLGGIGKTSIAKALYHKVKDEYAHIAWVEYQNSIKESLLNSFKIFGDVSDAAERLQKIERFLLNATKDTIIFIDNVSHDDFNGVDFIERLNANVVLTSRMSSIGNFKVFPVDFLSEEQCIEIFYKYYRYDKKREHKASVRKLVELVKCHTLSVELMARAANRPGYSLDVYAATLKEKGFEYPALSVKSGHTAVTQTIAKHLIKLFKMVSINDEQKKILKNFSLMPSIEIPAEVETWIGCHIDDMAGLTGLGWLTESETGYEMHPIVKEAVLLQYNEIQYEDFEAIIDYMSSDEYIKDTDIYTDVGIRLNIAESVMSRFCDVEREEIGLFFNNIAYEYSSQGDYPKALEWHQKALAIREKVLGFEHPSTATSYNNIASVHDSQGDYTKALEGYQKALAIREKVLGFEHPSTATSYNNIAYVYSSQGDYPKALEWYQKALAINEKVLGFEHPSTATSYNNIATVYTYQGDYPKALEWYQKALAINEKVLGFEHPSTATSYNNIATVHDSQGDYTKALEGHQKALAINEKVLGLEHPDTADSYNNIAYVYSRQGDYPKALEGYHKALAIREKVLGFEHPSTATSYNNIAAVYARQGDYPKALEGYQKDLAINEKVLGLEHPNTADSYNNIAYVYSRQGDYPKALEGYHKALVIREKVLGFEHPSTATSYNNIAAVYARQEDYPKATEWYQKALAIKEKVLGFEHPSTATS